jgi:hypothetical protein
VERRNQVKDHLRLRLLALLITIGEFIFGPEKLTHDPFDNVWIRTRFGGMELKFRIGDDVQLMFTVADDHEDVPFSVEPVTGGNDAEGRPIDAADFKTTDVESDNEDAVSVIDDPNVEGGKAFHFGAPGTAHAGYDLTYKGELVKRYEASFTVTTGVLDPASIVGGGITVPGLTEDPS